MPVKEKRKRILTVSLALSSVSDVRKSTVIPLFDCFFDLKAISAVSKMETKCIQNVSSDLGLGLDKDLDIDKDLDLDLDKGKEKNTRPQKHKYGEYQHVLLTDPEKERLIDDFGEDVFKAAIKLLDEYIEEKGYKSKSHNLAIRRWVINAVKERAGKTNNHKSVMDEWFNA